MQNSESGDDAAKDKKGQRRRSNFRENNLDNKTNEVEWRLNIPIDDNSSNGNSANPRASQNDQSNQRRNSFNQRDNSNRHQRNTRVQQNSTAHGNNIGASNKQDHSKSNWRQRFPSNSNNETKNQSSRDGSSRRDNSRQNASNNNWRSQLSSNGASNFQKPNYNNDKPNQRASGASSRTGYNNSSNHNNNYRHQFNDNEASNFQNQNLNSLNFASRDVANFWHQLKQRIFNLNKKKFELHPEEHNLWLDTWKAAAGGAEGPVKTLPTAYLLLPATSLLSPSPLIITQVLIRVAQSIENDTKYSQTHVFETIFDTISKRLADLIQSSNVESRASLLNAIQNLESILIPKITLHLTRFPDEVERLARLIIRKSELNDIKNKIKNLTSGEITTILDSKSNQSWLGWQSNPSLNWLLSGAWHRDVDGLKAMYGSSEEYAESLLKLWTLLTFYWGAGAVWPRCTFKQGDSKSAEQNSCGEPLLAPTTTGKCRKRGCDGDAAWRCFRYNHDTLCKKCLIEQQDVLIGSPGSNRASTDIYDALVEREIVRREESVYLLKDVESRKPPKIAPNWKTSKLACTFFDTCLKNTQFKISNCRLILKEYFS